MQSPAHSSISISLFIVGCKAWMSRWYFPQEICPQKPKPTWTIWKLKCWLKLSCKCRFQHLHCLKCMRNGCKTEYPDLATSSIWSTLPQVQNAGSESKATSIAEVLCLALLAILNRTGDSLDLAKWTRQIWRVTIQKDAIEIEKGYCIHAGYSYLQQLWHLKAMTRLLSGYRAIVKLCRKSERA